MPNINDFKAKLRGGGARANQFRVTMPFPGYAAVGGETESMSFLTTSTSLPGMTVTEVAIPFRGRELYVAGDRTFAKQMDRLINMSTGTVLIVTDLAHPPISFLSNFSNPA